MLSLLQLDQGRELIDCVWRGGVKLVSGGRHRAGEAIVARYARALRELRALRG